MREYPPLLIRTQLLGLIWTITLLSSGLSAQSQGHGANHSQPQKFALIIAIRDYPNSQELKPLVGTNRDAERLRDVLLKGGYSSPNIEIIYDEAESSTRLPTRQNILAALRRITSQATSNDEILVTATSHGISLNGTSYLCPADVHDDALYGQAAEQLISVHELTDQLSKCKATKKLVVIDACRDLSRSRTEGFVSSLSKPPEGVWLMSSCSEGQNSYLSSSIQAGENHAVYSFYFTRGLAGEADLLGNYDGNVSIAELQAYLHTKTEEEAQRQHVTQSPELFGGLVEFYNVATVSDYVAERTIISSDPIVERKQTCAIAASSALKKINAAQQRQIKQFEQQLQSRSSFRIMQASHQETFEQMCYILGNYLTPALELDPHSKLAHLARAHIFRSSGLYRQAADEYQQADEHFEMYVMSNPKALDAYLASRLQEQRPADDSSSVVAHLTPIELHQSPDAVTPGVGQVIPHSKIRIEQVQKDQKLNQEWLFVTAVDDMELPRGGWISSEHVVWFKEAADLYTPRTPMNRGGGIRMASTLSRMDTVANNMRTLADRLDQPAQRLNNAANNIDNVTSRIPGPFRAYVPNVGGQLRRAGGYLQIPGNRVRQAAGYAQMPANFTRAYGGGYVGAYRSGLERETISAEQHDRLLQAAILSPVADKPIHVSLAPWSAN